MFKNKNRFLYIAFLIVTEQVITDPYQARGKIGRESGKILDSGNDNKEKTDVGVAQISDIW